MACTSSKTWQMDDDQKLIIGCLSGKETPVTNKQIAADIALDTKKVTSKIKILRNRGFIDSPVRCKFALTDLGRKHLSNI